MLCVINSSIEEGRITMTNYPKYTKPEDLNSALTEAADGYLDWVKELLEDGADPNGMAMIKAIQCDQPEIVQMMVDAGAVVNAHVLDTTPLIHAIHGCYLPVIEVLLKAGADVNFKDENYQSPLAHANGEIRLNATKEERELMIKLLLSAGARE
jgi:ankyrin repeat protein